MECVRLFLPRCGSPGTLWSPTPTPGALLNPETLSRVWSCHTSSVQQRALSLRDGEQEERLGSPKPPKAKLTGLSTANPLPGSTCIQLKKHLSGTSVTPGRHGARRRKRTLACDYNAQKTCKGEPNTKEVITPRWNLSYNPQRNSMLGKGGGHRGRTDRYGLRRF